MKKSLFVMSMIMITTPALADIADIGDIKPFSLKCAQKIATAIEKEDAKSGYIGEGATMSIDEDVEGTSVLKASVTVNEADYMDGYSIWKVEVKGTGPGCRVLKVTLHDVAS